ncbi:MAG: tyrosine-type recombinase/integrase [Verrucomicrobiota bacterium]
MKNTSLLKHVFPLNHVRYSSLPVFGPVMEGFAEWLQSQGYTRRTIRGMSQGAYVIDHWLRRRRIASRAQITPEVLTAADAYFRPRDDNARWAGQALHRFLCDRHALPAPKPAVLSPSQKEAGCYATHLREVRGLAESTIVDHHRCVVRFLESIGYDRKQSALTQLEHSQIERFVQQMARTHDRHSLLNVVLTLRAFLRFEFSQGTLPRPLHEQLDTPRVYAGERLPCALTREQVRALLRSIDKTSPAGLRDFTMLFLIALYGLRRSDVVGLRLESIDWRNGVLHVKQAKTRQALSLPLTDEAGDVLARYLRKARPRSSRRELFLRSRAPEGPLLPWAVNVILQNRLKHSGLELGRVSPHTLRHSLAVHFLRRGVSMKCIGDTLGHRNLTSTAQYLRLNVDDLRKAGLPVPKPVQAMPLLTGDWHARFPKVRVQMGPRPRSQSRFRSAFGESIKQYIDTRRTLGCKYAEEEGVLRDWDAFLYRQKVKTLNRECYCLWAKTKSHLAAKTQRNYWYCVRGFLVHYARQHPRCFVPDQTPFRKPSSARLPRLVSTEEMARVLATAAQLENRKSTPLRSHTVQIGLTLLFCCGLRVGDAKLIKAADKFREQVVPGDAWIAQSFSAHLTSKT